jgi:hypothetical protein
MVWLSGGRRELGVLDFDSTSRCLEAHRFRQITRRPVGLVLGGLFYIPYTGPAIYLPAETAG